MLMPPMLPDSHAEMLMEMPPDGAARYAERHFVIYV